MLDRVDNIERTGQPSVAVAALDTVIRRQGALDVEAERKREVERLAAAEQKRSAISDNARDSSSNSSQVNASSESNDNFPETYGSSGAENASAQGVGGQIDFRV